MPTRFVYHTRVQHDPFPKLFGPLCRILFGTSAVWPDADRVDVFERMLMQSDEDADRAATALFGPSGNPRFAFRILKSSLTLPVGQPVMDVPDSLNELLLNARKDPAWLDRSRVERGAAVCRRLGLDAMGVLGDLALCGGYANPDISRPLTWTGQLKGDRTFDRLAETSRFWYDVTRAGAMLIGSKGWRSALHVRMMHAVIRQRILMKTNWDSDAWGLPINRADAVATNVAFSMAMIYGVRMLGYPLHREEIEDILHFWKYVGYLMGDNAEWLPDTLEEGLQCLTLIYLSNDNRPDADSIRLAKDYLRAFRPADQPGYVDMNLKHKLIRHMLYWRHRANAEYLIPPPLHRRLKLPSSFGLWILNPLLRVPLNAISGALSHRFPGRMEQQEKEGERLQTFVIRMMMGEREAEYAPQTA